MRPGAVHWWLLGILVLALAGCSGTSGTMSPSDAGSAVSQSSLVNSNEGAVLTASNGIRVIIPAGALSQSTLLHLTPQDGLLFDPPGGDFEAIPQHLAVDFNGAGLQAPIQVEAPLPPGLDPAHAELQAVLEEVRVPLPTVYNPQTRVMVGTFDLDPSALSRTAEAAAAGSGGVVVFGLLDETGFDSRPPHVPWPSYNVYLYTVGAGANGEDEFVRFISQGQQVGPVPELGDRPLLFVHGLGGSIQDQEYRHMAEYMRTQGNFTSLLGFEYDTLDEVTSTGMKLREAITQLNSPPYRPLAGPSRAWHQLGHSMGTLVTRYAFEVQGQPEMPIQKANVVLLCSPSLGSPAADAEQGFEGLMRAIKYLILNLADDWTNADGTPCQVTGDEPGFTNIRTDSDFLASLNAQPVLHPQAEYRVAAGGRRLKKSEILDLLLGVFMTDGLVNLDSATTPLMGYTGEPALLTNDDHFAVLKDDVQSFPTCLRFLSQPVSP